MSEPGSRPPVGANHGARQPAGVGGVAVSDRAGPDGTLGATGIGRVPQAAGKTSRGLRTGFPTNIQRPPFNTELPSILPASFLLFEVER